MTTSGSVALLFRRRCGEKQPKHFRACLVADACEDAVELLEKSKLPLLFPVRLTVTYGKEERGFDKDGEPLKLQPKPRYWWVRVEAVVLGENVKPPASMRRGLNGMIKPRWI